MATTQDPINSPEVRTAVTAVERLQKLTTAYLIETQEQYTLSGQYLVECKREQKRVEELRTSITGPINAGLKKINEFFAGPAVKLQTIEKDIKRGRLGYEQAQERIRAEAQRRLDEAAAKERAKADAAAAEIRRKAQVEADKAAKVAAEQRAAAEKARRETEAAERAEAKAKSDKARAAAAERAQEAAAREAEATENARKLEALAQKKTEAGEAKAVAIETAAAAPVAIVESTVPAVEGISDRVSWYGECTNLGLLIAAVAAGKAPAEFLVADTKAIAAYARKIRKPVEGSGIRVWSESAPVVRTGTL